MKRNGAILISLAVLAASGCSAERDPDAAASGEPSVEAERQIDAPLPPAGDSAATAAVTDAIPSALRGRWGLVAADCTSQRGDAKGLLAVKADELEFYESVAELRTVKEASSGSVLAGFDYSGEGETWSQDVRLELADGGSRLVRRDIGPDALPDPLTYMRCD
jgi:hypothetical protein